MEEDLNKDSEQAFREIENNELEKAHSLEKLGEKLDAEENNQQIRSRS